MPIYEYKCEKCGHEFEKLTSTYQSVEWCPKCGAEATKQPSLSNFQLKGDGWYNENGKSQKTSKSVDNT